MRIKVVGVEAMFKVRENYESIVFLYLKKCNISTKQKTVFLQYVTSDFPNMGVKGQIKSDNFE